jgi:acyl-CoA synthetase (AMP-forming)/AMP-acid ligase II
LRAVGARLQQVTSPGDRVAILAPQGIDYVVGFFAAVHAGAIAVPLFAPELPGHGERLDAVLADARPSVVLTTVGAAESVSAFLRKLPRCRRPRVIAVDAVPDSVGATFTHTPPGIDEVAYLQYTSGSTRAPAGVEITHRALCTNVLQMIVAGGLDMNIRSVSWLPSTSQNPAPPGKVPIRRLSSVSSAVDTAGRVARPARQTFSVGDEQALALQPNPSAVGEVGKCLVHGLVGRPDELSDLFLCQVVGDRHRTTFLGAEAARQLQQVSGDVCRHVVPGLAMDFIEPNRQGWREGVRLFRPAQPRCTCQLQS